MDPTAVSTAAIEEYVPSTAESPPIAPEQAMKGISRLVHCRAATAGAMTTATISTTPTTLTPMTVIATRAINPKDLTIFNLMPASWAKGASKTTADCLRCTNERISNTQPPMTSEDFTSARVSVEALHKR